MSRRDSKDTWPLDLARILLSLGVLLGHYNIFTFIDGVRTGFTASEQPFYAQLAYLYEFGGLYRVQAFWVISGFVLHLAYLASIRSGAVSGFDFCDAASPGSTRFTSQPCLRLHSSRSCMST